MTFKHQRTGDVLEIPPPDAQGRSVVRLNGVVVESVTYSDAAGGSVTKADGQKLTISQWVAYLLATYGHAEGLVQ